MEKNWEISLHKAFEQEFNELPPLVRQGLVARVNLLKQFGPTLGRPYIDTLKGSRFDNMKEIRFNANDGVWRVAFAFDPSQCAILLVAGDKAGVSSETKFYKKLIKEADQRFEAYLKG